VGSVVTVRYLYATADDRLYQAKYPVLRTDKEPKECTMDQLVYTNKAVHA
jgi:ATP-dependent DNA ligase